MTAGQGTLDLVALGRSDGFVRILDIDTRQTRSRLGPHDGAIEAVAFSGDGTVLAAAFPISTGQTPTWIVQLWDMRTGARGVRLQRDGINGIRRLALNRDGSWVAAAGTDVVVWDARSGLTHFVERNARAAHVRFDPDGSQLAFTTMDARLAIVSSATTPVVLADAGVENVNAQVDD